MPTRLTAAQIDELWDRYARGETAAMLARRFGKSTGAIAERIRASGGIRPHLPRRATRHLSSEEREEISRGLAAGASFRAIARTLGRAPSTVSREVGANGGRAGYRAAAADRAAIRRRRRPKVCKLAASPRLRELVQDKLELKWSPEQIAGWLKRTHPGRAELQVSHETIYRSLYVQARGALRRELARSLRTGRVVRQPGGRNRARGAGRGQLVDVVSIAERPAEANERAVPGHWEGDLLLGKRRSAIATLVERATRFLVLVRLEGTTSSAVLTALREHVGTLPDQLLRSLTWDQGKEMAHHARFSLDTGLQIYLCDPSSPWQRGTAENTNGLLRQYFPKGTDLKTYSQEQLDAIAAELNGRPRKTLEFMTPSEKFAEAVAVTR